MIGRRTASLIASLATGLAVCSGASPAHATQLPVVPAAAVAANPSFSSAAYPTFGDFPKGLVFARFNGDPDPDLAVVNVGDPALGNGNLSMLAGGAGTSLSGGTIYGLTDQGPWAVTARDFDQDARGRPDIAYVNEDGNSLDVRRNPNGVLSGLDQLTRYTGHGSPRAVIAVNLNSGGDPDLVIADGGSNTVSVRKGGSAMSFGSRVSYSVGVSPSDVAAGDFDRDGDLDIVSANLGSGNVTVRLNDGQGNFPASGRKDFSAGPSPFAVVARDFDGDGDLDLAVANGGNPGTVQVLRGLTGAGFSTPTAYAAQNSSTDVSAGDLNRDGDLDLAVTNIVSNTVTVRLGMTGALFGPPLQFAAGSRPSQVEMADLDGDGDLDMAITNEIKNGRVTVLTNTTP